MPACCFMFSNHLFWSRLPEEKPLFLLLLSSKQTMNVLLVWPENQQETCRTERKTVLCCFSSNKMGLSCKRYLNFHWISVSFQIEVYRSDKICVLIVSTLGMVSEWLYESRIKLKSALCTRWNIFGNTLKRAHGCYISKCRKSLMTIGQLEVCCARWGKKQTLL